MKVRYLYGFVRTDGTYFHPCRLLRDRPWVTVQVSGPYDPHLIFIPYNVQLSHENECHEAENDVQWRTKISPGLASCTSDFIWKTWIHQASEFSTSKVILT